MRRRKATVELFEQIRREYEFGVGTIQGVARRFGVHRRMVREALAGAIPTMKVAPPRTRPRLGPVTGFIDEILVGDLKVPRKQRHTAHRIYTRLRAERGEYPVAESTVRQYVRERKQALGLRPAEVYVPQSYEWGSEAQVDWYEASAVVDGEVVTLQGFAMRSMASGGAFHRAYRRATQQAFLEGLQLGFRHFGGVFRRVRFDNLAAAVKRVLRGSRREETTRFVAFRSHWQFEAEFCTPEEAHEKGGIENEVGTFRRNHWVPLPRAGDLEALNTQLLAACQADEARVLVGRSLSVGSAMLVEREYLRPLAAVDFDTTEVCYPHVNTKGMVSVRTNVYSVPVRPGRVVEVRVTPTAVQCWYEGRCVASHERTYGHGEEVYNLEHYLDVLEHKPGALAGSKPLAQWRQLGRWPESYDRLWQQLVARQGKQAGTKALIELLQLGKTCGHERLREAIEQALALGCVDVAAVRHLVTAHTLARPPAVPLALPRLASYERPLPTLGNYDELLTGSASAQAGSR